MLFSRSIDQVVVMALLGDNQPLERLKRASDQERAGHVLADLNGICRLDAWAFNRATRFAMFSLPLLGKMADLGLLQNARCAATGRTLIHWLVANPSYAATEAVMILGRAGVDFGHPDWAGTTPVQLASAMVA